MILVVSVEEMKNIKWAGWRFLYAIKESCFPSTPSSFALKLGWKSTFFGGRSSYQILGLFGIS